MPLVHGQGPLTAANGFGSQAEVVINARGAGDLVGATKMDRPEDVEPSPRTGKVYCALTSNDARKPDQVDKANPRPANKYGHILELIEDGGDHASTRFRWEILLLGGDPKDPSHGAFYQGRTDVSPVSVPDNFAFDDQGRLWVATDGMDDTLGPERRRLHGRYGRALARPGAPVPVGADGMRGVRAGLHAGQPDVLRGDAASGPHRQGHLRRAGQPLAGQPSGHAAAPQRRGDPSLGRREGRRVGRAGPLLQ